METVPRRLAEHLGKAVHTGVEIESIKADNGQWLARWRSSDSNVHQSIFDSVVLTVPAYRLAELPWATALLGESAPFSGLEYPPVASD